MESARHVGEVTPSSASSSPRRHCPNPSPRSASDPARHSWSPQPRLRAVARPSVVQLRCSAARGVGRRKRREAAARRRRGTCRAAARRVRVARVSAARISSLRSGRAHGTSAVVHDVDTSRSSANTRASARRSAHCGQAGDGLVELDVRRTQCCSPARRARLALSHRGGDRGQAGRGSRTVRSAEHSTYLRTR